MVLNGYRGRFPFRSRESHTLRVAQWAQRIWNEDGENADPEVLLCAALLHDIGYYAKNGEDHAEIGAELAESYLRNEGYEPDFIRRVCYCIRLHSHKEYLKQPERFEAELTPELQILMEADLLDECGAIAVVFDCMAEGLETEQSFEKTYQRIQKNSPEFLECNWMKSPSARIYWQERQTLLRDFLEQYRAELFLDEKIPQEYEAAAAFMIRTMRGHDLVPNRHGIVYPFRQKDRHMLRVFFQARRLFKNEKARQKDRRHELTPYARKVLSYAALLHDIGYRKTSDGYLHAPAGAQMAEEYMRSQGLPEELCRDTARLIEMHADKTLLEKSDTPPLLRLLMEADHQDESGALSIVWDSMAVVSRSFEKGEGTPLQTLDYGSALTRIRRNTGKMYEKCVYQTASGKECWNQKERFVKQFILNFQFDLVQWSPSELESILHKEAEKL